MKFWEAMKAMEEGAMVRCKCWAYQLYADKYYTCNISQLAEDEINGEWELYDDTPQLNFQQVIAGLKEGKKFRRADWYGENYILIKKEIILYFHGEADPSPWHLYLKNFEATDWICVDDAKT